MNSLITVWQLCARQQQQQRVSSTAWWVGGWGGASFVQFTENVRNWICDCVFFPKDLEPSASSPPNSGQKLSGRLGWFARRCWCLGAFASPKARAITYQHNKLANSLPIYYIDKLANYCIIVKRYS